MLNKITYLFLIFIAFSCSSSYIGKISSNETINTENSLYVNYIPILSNSEKFQNVNISSIVLDSLKPILNKKNINEIVSLEEFSSRKKFNQQLREDLSRINKTKTLDSSPQKNLNTILNQKDKRFAIILASNPTLQNVKTSIKINDTIHNYVNINYNLVCLVYDRTKQEFVFYNQIPEKKSSSNTLGKNLLELLDF